MEYELFAIGRLKTVEIWPREVWRREPGGMKTTRHHEDTVRLLFGLQVKEFWTNLVASSAIHSGDFMSTSAINSSERSTTMNQTGSQPSGRNTMYKSIKFGIIA